jgi:nucleoside-diphosphate-sugar epimerase
MKIYHKTSEESFTVNLGSDMAIPIGTLAEKIIKISDKDIDIKFDDSKPVGPLSRSPDLSKIKIFLNWEPTTTLEEGLRPTYEWVEETLIGKKQLITKR